MSRLVEAVGVQLRVQRKLLPISLQSLMVSLMIFASVLKMFMRWYLGTGIIRLQRTSAYWHLTLPLMGATSTRTTPRKSKSPSPSRSKSKSPSPARPKSPKVSASKSPATPVEQEEGEPLADFGGHCASAGIVRRILGDQSEDAGANS